MLRLLGIRNGLPYLYNVDEPDFVSISVHMLRVDHLNPHWWGHPGSTLLYVLEAMYGMIYVVGHALKTFASPADFQALYLRDPTVFYLSGRLLCAFIGVLSIGLTYVIGTRIFSRTAALFAAALVAVAPFHVDVSRLLRTDILATFFVLVAFWLLIKALRENDSAWYYGLAGFAVGLATATKYPTVLFVFVVIAGALGIAPRTRALKLAGLGALGTVAGVIVGSPLLLPNFRTVLKDVLYENRESNLGLTGHGFLGNLGAYVSGSLPETLTWLGVVLAFAGILACFRTDRRVLRLVPIYPLLLIVFLSGLHLFRSAWLIPALPFFALAAGYAVDTGGTWLARIRGVLFSRACFAVLASVIIVSLGWTDVVSGRELDGIETRTLAANWIMQHVPEHSRILEEQAGPQLPSRRFRYYVVSMDGTIAPAPEASLRFAYYRPDMDWKSAALGELRDDAQLKTARVDYVVVSQQDAYAAEAASYSQTLSGYSRLAALGKRVFEVSPERGVRTGPVIDIYRM